ncbi:hypothetical protein ACFL20_10870 [Spirochaetota bacterium]
MNEGDRRLISGFIFDILESCKVPLNTDKYMEFSINWEVKKTSDNEGLNIQSKKSNDFEIENINSLLIKNLEIIIDGERVKSE